MTYEDVKKIVSKMSDANLADLSEGPLPAHPTDEGCRACDVLERENVTPTRGSKVALLKWHNFEGRMFRMLSAISQGTYPRKVEDDLAEEITELLGALSYSRCLVIYSCAWAELEGRRRHRVENGLDADGEPPDDRDADQGRQDEEAEAAERTLDSERAAGYPGGVNQA